MGLRMEFLYNAKKAAQAAAYLVSLRGGQMDMFALVKILYLSDRKSLAMRGRPITGDAMVSMPHGPVLSRIYDGIKVPEEFREEPWSEYLAERDGTKVSLRNPNPPSEELSQFEREILRETLEQYGHFGFAELKNFTHALPEYRDPKGSSLPIDPETILRNEGWTDEEIQDALMNAREELFFSRIARA
jgi:uncharacterized phage-associated protein